MSGPNSKPEVSEQQAYRTPKDFLDRVRRKFQVDLRFDLACTREDAVAPAGFYYPEQDALAYAWPNTAAVAGACAWANPPFNRSSAFARAASESPHCRTLMLIPASVGSNWFAEHVNGRALVVFLRPRLVFLMPDGTPCPAGINRDCMLLGFGWQPGYHCEDWRTW
jgi:hypothetical protein